MCVKTILWRNYRDLRNMLFITRKHFLDLNLVK